MSSISTWRDGRFKKGEAPYGWDEAIERISSLGDDRIRPVKDWEEPTGYAIDIYRELGGFIADFFSPDQDGCHLVWMEHEADYLDLLTSGRIQAWLNLPA